MRNIVLTVLASLPFIAGCDATDVASSASERHSPEVSILATQEITINTRLAPGGTFREHSRVGLRQPGGMPVGTFKGDSLHLNPESWKLELGGEALPVDLPRGNGVFYNRGVFAFLQEDGLGITVYSLHAEGVVQEIRLAERPSSFILSSDGHVWARQAGDVVRFTRGGEGTAMEIPIEGFLLDAWGNQVLMSRPDSNDRLLGTVVEAQPLSKNGQVVY